MNPASELRAAEARLGETIEAIVIGVHASRVWDDPREGFEDKVLSRNDGLRHLDYTYNNGLGGADCHPFHAWTKNWLICVSECDGSTGHSVLPRHPTAISPEFL